MTDSIIPFHFMVTSQLWISLPFPLMIFPAQTKDTGIPIIRYQPTFLLPMDTLLLLWPHLLTPIIYFHELWWYWNSTYHHKLQNFPWQGEERILFQGPWWKKILQKIEVLLLCVSNEQELLLMSYTYHNRFTVKDMINWTYKFYSPLFGWLVGLHPFYPLIYLLNLFLSLFPSWFLDPTLFQCFYLI